MTWSERQVRTFWRTKFPWFFVMYILLIGILRGSLQNIDHTFSMNLMMIAAFTSYIFLYIFYLYGVRPNEMEDWHKKHKMSKKPTAKKSRK